MVTESLARVLAMARSAVGLAERLLGESRGSWCGSRATRAQLTRLRRLIDAVEQLGGGQR